jgi:serine protease Do
MPSSCLLGLTAVAALVFPSRANDDPELLMEQTVRKAVERVAPSVVKIETLGGLERVGRLLVGTGPTTGLAVTPDGYILSSAFNFVSKPTSILVTLPSGKRSAASIVARDESRMLVLLKVETDEKFPVPEALPRDQLQVGQTTIAVGRTYPGPTPNISVGILSAANRIWGKAIQTDAKISPSNYGGPLIDLEGRVLGLLVPLSPQAQGEVAGAEWYDAGIGFAVPLTDVLRQLDKMKKGEDLQPGILGISLKPGNMFADPAEIGACHGNSPASKAGFKKGDVIVEVDGIPVRRQSELKHALGARYAGDKVKVVAMRGEERIEAILELIDKLDPYAHPFLGILPKRYPAKERGGVVVRYVYAGSPADEAGIMPGDRLTHLGTEPIPDGPTMQEMIATIDPTEPLKVVYERGGKSTEVSVKTQLLPTDVPPTLPPAGEAPTDGNVEGPQVGVVEIKLPEESNECFAYVPPTYHPEVPHGVFIWLHAPGGYDRDALLERWKKHCDNTDLILLAPNSADPKKWERTEAAFVHKALEDVLANYNIDRTRIVVGGYQGGAAMAYLVGFTHRELIRGIATVDAALPARTRPPANDPIQRLAFYTTTAAKSVLASQIEAGVKKLREMKYPVTVHSQGDQAGRLNDAERSELIRWIDTLDRI